MRPCSRFVSSLALLLGCTSTPVDSGPEGASGKRGSGDPDGPAPAQDGVVELDVSARGRTYLDLAALSFVASQGTDTDWDLAFQGYDVYTNGGASGNGRGSAFGPLSPPTFLSDTAPDVPRVVDEPGGAFLRWYAYDSDHVLLSRFHVYALRDGDRHYKLQILSYYQERGGARLSARYSLRYAEVTSRGVSPPELVMALDATGETPESECLNLETGERLRLTVEQSAEDDRWHVCFRRDAIRVNGGASGPRGVEAVDLDAAATELEGITEIRARSAQSELGRFDAVDYARLTGPELVYRLDGIQSAFAGRWFEPTEPPTPKDAVWLVVGADSQSYLLAFDAFSGATAEAPGRVRLRVKAVQ